jgi:hypothetical protein
LIFWKENDLKVVRVFGVWTYGAGGTSLAVVFFFKRDKEPAIESLDWIN